MPTYEYECRKCGHRFERSQSMKTKPSAFCPRCKGSAKRLISSGGGLLFKGSGFYITDHRSSNYKKRAASDTKSSSPVSEKKALSPSKD